MIICIIIIIDRKMIGPDIPWDPAAALPNPVLYLKYIVDVPIVTDAIYRDNRQLSFLLREDVDDTFHRVHQDESRSLEDRIRYFEKKIQIIEPLDQLLYFAHGRQSDRYTELLDMPNPFLSESILLYGDNEASYGYAERAFRNIKEKQRGYITELSGIRQTLANKMRIIDSILADLDERLDKIIVY